MGMDSYKEVANRIRKRTLDLVYGAKAPHIGSALSCVDILTAIYATAQVEKIKTECAERDRVILSKGHAIAAQLSTLCEFGLLSKKNIMEFCKPGSVYPENTAAYTPFIEVPTGSLGQGVSFAVGAAYGMKLRGYDESRAFVIIGDGELNEGQCWEAFSQASFHKLDNLLVFIDANGLAGIGETCDNQGLPEKMRAFGFDTEILEGHDVDFIIDVIRKKRASEKPKAFICNTIKGYGVSFMEHNNNWHYRPVSENDYLNALKELSVEDNE